ncbi:hypothetical protein [Chitinimonas lacunae]|uniref:Uncharacterized protein n=1 Tax=Chitinimonas lacunae TaxID=1963018 RepID=A0ABV8MRN4_9NEIS
MVQSNRNNDVCLLFLEGDKSIIPVALSAFHVAQSAKKQLESYVGALVVNREGEAYLIRQIERVGLHGDGFPRKILSALTGAYDIKVEFERRPAIELESFKLLLIEYLAIDSEKGDPFLPQDNSFPIVLEQIKRAKNFEEIFEVIKIPSAEDALDVL